MGDFVKQNDSAVNQYAKDLKPFVFVLFFAFGGITSLNDVLIPKLKALFTLSYRDVMLVQSAFFAAYLIVSIPAAALVRKIGYMRSAVVGLLTMTVGCLLFEPASSHGTFGLFLVALFVLASGITTVQVVANPLISRLGSPSTASSRLTFAQAFNSLGTTIFPYVGSVLILGSFNQTHIVVETYRGLAAELVVLAAVVWFRRNALVEKLTEHTSILRSFGLLTRPRFAFGALCIFLYVGAEVAIGSVIVSYLMQGDVLGIGAEDAGKHVPYYWGLAMLGRFLGAYVLRVIRPGKVLACAAGSAMLLLILSATTAGSLSAWFLLAIGLFNSIMFPTIFTLAGEGLGDRTAEGSGIICVAIVGGAVVPILTGRVADLSSLRWALLVPAACYSFIVLFGCFARRPIQLHAPLAAAS